VFTSRDKGDGFCLAFTAAVMTGGAIEYSAKRSSQVFSTTECTSTILAVMSPAFLNSAALPLPTSTTGTCLTGANAGAHAMDTQRTRNWDFRNLREFGIKRGPGGADGHLGRAFRPGMRDGEFFGVDAISSGCFEHVYAPIDGALHGGCAGNASSDFVRQFAQVVLYR